MDFLLEVGDDLQPAVFFATADLAHYIAGEKMRAGKREVEEALSRSGRFSPVRDNLEVKEVVVGEGEARKRYVVVRNPK